MQEHSTREQNQVLHIRRSMSRESMPITLFLAHLFGRARSNFFVARIVSRISLDTRAKLEILNVAYQY